MRSFKFLSIPVLVMVTTYASLAQTQETSSLSVTVDGLRNGQGAVIVAAFDRADAFEAMDVSKAAAMAYLPAANTKISVTFHDLPRGAYAFAALHDEDGDSDLGMNGDVPSEGYAFSAMGRSGLPSKFEDAAVATGDVATSTLRLKYWN
ncbi:DUF2141 domain-containing protein [Aliiroseovarius sp. 2305UL8-7]|uniref:DUF2141 domain-containing protein n=1 Tax=Aliiroseovarius conchicola TaxID=3121637 RepID=UPI00352704BC